MPLVLAVAFATSLSCTAHAGEIVAERIFADDAGNALPGNQVQGTFNPSPTPGTLAVPAMVAMGGLSRRRTS